MDNNTDNLRIHTHRRTKFFLMMLARAILLIAIVFALVEGRKLLLLATIVLLIYSFLPEFFRLIFKKESNIFFDIVILFLIFGVLSYWEIRGVYANFTIFAIAMNFAQAVAIGLLGLTLVYTFFKYSRMKESIVAISVFSFCLSFSLGVLIELGEMGIDKLFSFSIHESGVFGTTGDLMIYFLGCILVSFAGYFSLKKGKVVFVSKFLEDFIDKHSKLFGFSSSAGDDYAPLILELIKKGEGDNIEFKSTLRKNLYTKVFDRNIEHAVLKTITAYLNSGGGTLLIGVSDKGEVIGISEDEFSNKEHVNRHLNNIITTHIGAEFIPFIRVEIINFEDKLVILVECKKSHREVFLKHGNEEYFYVRRGSLSMPLTGSSLLSYIETKFRRKS